MEWKEVLLSEFLEFNPKRTIKKNEVARKITMDLLIPHSKQIYSFKYEPYTGGAKFSNGDTIMARITPCLENGKHAYVSCLNEGEIAYGSTEYIVLCGKNGVSDNEFVYYLSHTPQFVNTAIKSMVGSSGRQRAQVPVLENLIMPVPVNLSDQRKIAGILSALDSKIENNNKINANLEAQAEALFKSWFVDFTPFKDKPFVDSELGPIPQGWKVGKLGDYCETICRGLTPKYNLDSKEIVLGQTCVRNNIVTLNNARKHQPKGKTEKKVQQWATLINSTGIGSLGRVGIVYFDYNYVSFDSHITVVRATNPLLRPYIGRNLVSRQLEIENLAIGSTGQTELPRESVKSITLYIPTQKVLESFNCIIKPLSLKILKNIQENQRLAALRDTLLPKLMSGEIKL